MTDLRKMKFERHSGHTEGGECTCASRAEHERMVMEVNISFQQDYDRAKLRQDRNTHNLRMNVLRELNGHSRD